MLSTGERENEKGCCLSFLSFLDHCTSPVREMARLSRLCRRWRHVLRSLELPGTGGGCKI
jgi:hypothetical protein